MKGLTCFFILAQLSCTGLYAQESDTIADFMHFMSGPHTSNAAVLSKSCKLYSRPDTTGRIMRIVGFGTRLNFIEAGQDSLAIEEPGGIRHVTVKWFKTEGGTFVRASDVAMHCFVDELKKVSYYFRLDNPLPTDSISNMFVYRYDNVLKKFTDTLVTRIDGGYHSFFRIEGVTWKNLNILFRIHNTHFHESQSISDVYIADADGKLSVLLTSSSLIKGEHEKYISKVWIPVMFRTKNSVLMENGDMFDMVYGILTVPPRPKDLSIPISDIVVVKSFSQIPLVGKNKKPVKNKDGSIKLQTESKTQLYKWNGRDLEKTE